MRFLAVLLSILLLVVGVKLVLNGNHEYEDSHVFLTPEKVTYDQFATDRPLVGWYQISGCELNMTEGAFRSAHNGQHPNPNNEDRKQFDIAPEAYIPVHSTLKPEARAEIILLTRDGSLHKTLKEIRDLPSNTDGFTPGDAYIPRVLDGMVRTPSELPDRIRELLGDSISTQTIILEEGVYPSEKRGLETMGAGAGMTLFTAFLWLFIWKHDRKPFVIPEEYLPAEDIPEEDETGNQL